MTNSRDGGDRGGYRPEAREMEALQLMARRLGHDLNNLLQPVLGYAHLARTTTDRDKLEGYLSRIVEAVDVAGGLVERISQIGRRTAGQHKPLQLSEAVGESLRRIRSDLPDGITLDADLAGAVPPVLGSEDEIYLLMERLCSNAQQAMSGGGELSVGVDVVEPAGASGLSPGEYARLTVADTGDGMAPDTLERVFVPFFSTRPSGIGRGVGMVAVYDIVTGMGGEVLVSSEPGKGTTVRVFIPVHTG